jgi:hypothetical protein
MAQQMKHAFIVTSAINSKFGVYKPAERLEQTIGTIKSIKSKIPDAKIFVMECCGTPITNEQANQLIGSSDGFIDYSTNPDVQAMYDSDNWDVVKNGTEIMCFGRVLNQLKAEGKFEGVDRIHKMSGRYILNDMFDPMTYDQSDVADKFVIGPKFKSQFPVEVTTQPWQYMARLWSWPRSRLDEAIKVYEDSLVFFAERLAAGGYVDIEHVLARFLNPDHVHEIQNLGVEGCIAPNGQPIKN